MNKVDIKLMRIALSLAAKELIRDELPVGAIVVKDGKTIGKNKAAHFVSLPMGHAEMSALDNNHISYGKRDLILYTTLEPCIMCMGTILHFPVGKVVYALEDPYGGASCIINGPLPVRHGKNKIPEIVSGVLREESLNLLREFFQNTKNDYWSNNSKNPLFKLCMI